MGFCTFAAQDWHLPVLIMPFLAVFLLTASSLCDREEWAWLQSHVYTTTNGSAPNLLSGEDESLMESSGLVEFVRSLRAAVTHLLTKLNIPLYRVNMLSNSHLQILLSEQLCYELFKKEKIILNRFSLSVFILFYHYRIAFWVKLLQM